MPWRGEIRLERPGELVGVVNISEIECFPLQVLRLEAPVREFYDFYGVTPEAA